MALRASDILGDDFYRLISKGYDRDQIAQEAQKRLEPVRQRLGDRFDEYVSRGVPFHKMRAAADALAQEEAKRQKAQEEARKKAQEEAMMHRFDSEYGGDGIWDRFKRGARRVGAELSVVNDYINPFADGKYDPEDLAFLKYADKKGEEYAAAHRTPQEQAEYEKDAKAFAEANGVLDTVKTGANLIYDKLSNPSEWDVAGGVVDFFNPINFVGGGAGKFAGRFATSAAKKAALGAAAGAANDGIINAGYAYALEDAKSGDKNAAEKAAILGGTVGATIGAAYGALGGLAQKTAKQLDEFRPKSDSQNANYEDAPPRGEASSEWRDIEIPDAIKHSELLAVDDAERASDAAFDAMKRIDEAVPDRKKRDDVIARNVPPTPSETYLSEILHGKQVSPAVAGNRLRNRLKTTIDHPDAPLEDVARVLDEYGISGDMKQAALEAYAKRDIGIYDKAASEKIARHIIRKAENDIRSGIRNDGQKTIPDDTSSLRGGGVADRKSVDSSERIEPSDGLGAEDAYGVRDARRHRRGDMRPDRLPEGREEVARRRGVEDDGGAVPGDQTEPLVQGEVRRVPFWDEFKDTVGRVESNGNYEARNERSGAFGKYHFLPSTLDDIARSTGKDVDWLKSKEGQEFAFDVLTHRNAQSLERAGIPVTPFTLYGAHQQGAKAFARIYRNEVTQKDLERMAANLPKEAQVSGDIRKDWMAYWESRMGPSDDVVVSRMRKLRQVAQDQNRIKVKKDVHLPKDVQAIFGDSAVYRSISGDSIRHILKHHGDNERLRGQDDVTLEDIARYPEWMQSPDRYAVVSDGKNKLSYISAKRVNGHYVVVEEMSTKKGRLSLKTMKKPSTKEIDGVWRHMLRGRPLLLTSETVTGRLRSGRAMLQPLDAILTQKHDAVKRAAALKHRYFDKVLEIAKESLSREQARIKRPSHDPFDAFHKYTKTEIKKLESGTIDDKLLRKLYDDLQTFYHDPRFQSDRDFLDEATLAFGSQSEIIGEDIAAGLRSIHRKEIDKNVEETIHQKIDQGLSTLYGTIERFVKLPSAYVKSLSLIPDPFERYRMLRTYEQIALKRMLAKAKKSGDQNAIDRAKRAMKRWNEKNLDENGVIKDLGDCL